MNDYFLPESSWPPALPTSHRECLKSILKGATGWAELEGVAVGGSFLTGRMDQYSDLDLLVVVAANEWPNVEQKRRRVAESLGPLAWSFSGEHVGVPNMLICLYGEPPLHVDLKFLVPMQLEKRVEDPIILWDRRGAVHAAMSNGTAHYPEPEVQWMEDRFWPWIHYLMCKVGRGELFEAVESLSFLREKVLGPLALARSKGQPNGVRHLERDAPNDATRIEATIAKYDSNDIVRATRECISIYRAFRTSSVKPIVHRTNVEKSVLSFLESVESTMHP